MSQTAVRFIHEVIKYCFKAKDFIIISSVIEAGTGLTRKIQASLCSGNFLVKEKFYAVTAEGRDKWSRGREEQMSQCLQLCDKDKYLGYGNPMRLSL